VVERGVRGPCCDIITTYAPQKKKILIIKTKQNKKYSKKKIFYNDMAIIAL